MALETLKTKDGEEIVRWTFPPATTGSVASSTESTPPEAILPGLAYRGHTTLLSGQPKAGKSTFLRDCIRRIAKAHDSPTQHSHFMLRDRMVKAANVLVFSEEAPYQWNSFFADMRSEDICRAATKFGEADCDFDWVRIYDRRHAGITPSSALERKLWINAVIDMVDAHSIDLVCIDPLTRFLALENENDNASVLAAMVDLERIASEGKCALLMLHHTGKSGGQARGASAFLQNPDVLLTLRLAREEEEIAEAPEPRDVRIITGAGRFPEIESEMACWLTEDGFEATRSIGSIPKRTQTDEDADEILRYVGRVQPEQEMLEDSIFDGIPGGDIRRECKLTQVRMQRAMRMLISKNALRKTGTTRNAKYSMI